MQPIIRRRAILIIYAFVLSAAVFLILNGMDMFRGYRVNNPDRYSIEFDEMNRTDTAVLKLRQGDRLTLDFAVDRGRVDLRIGAAGETPIYNEEDIHSGVFTMEAPGEGEYNVTVKARHAAGFLRILRTVG